MSKHFVLSMRISTLGISRISTLGISHQKEDVKFGICKYENHEALHMPREPSC